MGAGPLVRVGPRATPPAARPRPPRRLAGSLAFLVAALLVACGGPSPTQRPGSAPPGSSPGPSGGSGPAALVAVFPLPSIRATIPGLYTDASVYAVGNEQVSLLLSSLRCTALADLIGAGEWREVVRILAPFSAGPSVTPPPSPPDVGWLILERGPERMMVRLGGRAECSAWAMRTSVERFELTGTFRAGPTALLDQACRASNGSAMVRLDYALVGSDVRLALELAIPLAKGEHPIAVDDLEVTVARAPLSAREVIGAHQAEVRAGQPLDKLLKPSGAVTLKPGSPAPGRVTVTSSDPLVGEIRLDGLLGAGGETASLVAGFRCDLPGGELSRALAVAGGGSGASPGPSGAPGATTRPPAAGAGKLTVTFGGGPDAGNKEAGSADFSCTYGEVQPGAWQLDWAGIDERPGSLLGLIASVPVAGRTGTSSGAAMTIYVAGANGDERRYGLGGDAGGSVTFQVSPGSGIVTFDFDGRTGDGTRLTGRLVCPAS